MSFVLTYNTVTIQNANLDEYSDETVYDDSGDNIIGRRYTFGITGVIGELDGADLSAEILDYKTKLEQPRKDLLVTVGSSILLQMTQDTPEFNVPDQESGPKPEFVNIVQIVGQRAAYVRFRVIAFQQDVQTVGELGAVTTHRFSTSHEIDENGYITRTIDGYLRTRDNKRDDSNVPFPYDSDQNITNPDYWRVQVTPPLPDGFRRESMRFVVDSNGRNMAYQIVDTDHYRSFGANATSGRGEYQLQYNNGGFWTKTLSVELEAPKNVPKKEVMRGCVDVMLSRMDLGEGSDFLNFIAITEDIFRNRVTLSARADSLNPGGPGTDIAGFGQEEAFNTLFKDVIWQPSPGREDQFPELSPYGLSLVQAVKPQFFDPVTFTRTDAKAVNWTQGTTVPLADAVQFGVVAGGWDVAYTQVFQATKNLVDAEQVEFPYLSVIAIREYREDMGMVGMAVAPVSADGDFGIPADQVLTRFWQAREPLVYIIERGTHVRIGLPPVLPKPLPPVGGVVIKTTYNPGAPTIGADTTQVTYEGNYEHHYAVSPSAAQKLVATEEILEIDGNGYPLPDGFVQWRTRYDKLRMGWTPTIKQDGDNPERDNQEQYADL